MKFIKLELTPEELKLLTTLAADQLFRKEFIDPKMPGYRSDNSEITQGKALVQRLRQIVDPASVVRTAASAARKASNSCATAARKKPDAL